MQVLIALGFVTSAFAVSDFNAKVNAHSKAVADTKAHVVGVGEAQLKFKELTNSCASKNVTTQEMLSKFH